MDARSSGYSGIPLFKKLGLKDSFHVKLVAAPANYKELLGELSATLIFENVATTELDFIHLFTNSIKEFEEKLPLLKEQIKKDGMIWVSWYKKSSRRTTELSDNLVRDTALAIGLVDIKVCSVDKDWSDLKLVFRLKDR